MVQLMREEMKPCLVAQSSRKIEILLLNNEKSEKIDIDEKQITVEEICKLIAIRLGIGPLCRHLFTLKAADSEEWMCQHFIMQNITYINVFVYRLRFKVSNLKRFKELDLAAFNYYYHQVQTDVLAGNVRNLNYEVEEGSILGLSVTDMYRVMLEEKVSVAEIEARYKLFIPKIILKKHLFGVQIKQKVIAALNTIVRLGHNDLWYIKEEYLMHFERIGHDYLVDDFNAQVDENGGVRYVTLLVNPFHNEMPGIQVTYLNKDKWTHVCSIEDLCFVSVREDGTIEICRKNGIPLYYCFIKKSQMYGFVSLLDGYYRLSIKWTFNICKDVFTPSVKTLHKIKCHGPVGGQFSYAKLLEKRENKKGTFILRECEKSHHTIFIDVCVANNSRPKTYRMQLTHLGSYEFSYDQKCYPSIPALVTSFKEGVDKNLELLECIPPSETDKSQVLICGAESWASQLADISNPEELLLTSAPQCLNIQNLQVFPGSRIESRSGKTFHYRAMWKHNKTSRIKVVMKELKPELRDVFLSEFLELAGRWACLQSNSIVKLFGVTLTGKLSMISEYLEMGPLDNYLINKQQEVQKVDLIEACASLAMGLWQMEEAGMTHGHIRCSKVFVFAHDDRTMKVKICDPGLHKLTEADIPWVPPECYENMNRAKAQTSADVWAFGTTIWEIFSYGKKPSVSDKAYYLNGNRLPQPFDCPIDIFQLILECWDPDPYKRKNPQAIVRDVNHILYQVFNSRRNHSYATTYPRSFHSLTESEGSLRSDATDETLLNTEVPTDELIPVDISDANYTDLSLNSDSGQLIIFRQSGHYSTQANPHMGLPRSAFNSHFREETIFQMGKDCNVILQGRIGQGHYGQVFKGVLDRVGHGQTLVAVKQLKAESFNTSLDDFKREIEIMLKIEHENIVRIIGAIQEQDMSLVMEYVRYGSLQGYLRMHKDVLGPHNLLKFAEDVAKGMEYLGKKKIVHRDLAARNILVANENHVKISDFGLAQFVDGNNGDYYLMQTDRELPIKWYAPENLKGNRFSSRSDVWSYGITLFEMFTFGEDPQLENSPDKLGYQGQFNALVNNCRLPCPPSEGAQDVYRALMMPCWRFEPQQRPSFSEIILKIDKMRRESFHIDSNGIIQ